MSDSDFLSHANNALNYMALGEEELGMLPKTLERDICIQKLASARRVLMEALERTMGAEKAAEPHG